MKARLLTSKKWTAFPQEYTDQIRDVFQQEFAPFLANSKLVVEGRIYPEEILLRVGFVEQKQIRQNNFEVSLTYTRKDKDIFERISNCIDAAASMMNEFFQSEGEVELPRDWKEFDFGNSKIFFQYSTTNTDLEAQADAILGEELKNLVYEDEDSEDALARASEKIESDEDDSAIDEFGPDDEDAEDSADEEVDQSEEQEVRVKPKIFSKTSKSKTSKESSGNPKKKRKEDLH